MNSKCIDQSAFNTNSAICRPLLHIQNHPNLSTDLDLISCWILVNKD